jgi:hypothetical protein
MEYIRRCIIRASFDFCLGTKWKGGNGGGKRDEIRKILFLILKNYPMSLYALE